MQTKLLSTHCMQKTRKIVWVWIVSHLISTISTVHQHKTVTIPLQSSQSCDLILILANCFTLCLEMYGVIKYRHRRISPFVYLQLNSIHNRYIKKGEQCCQFASQPKCLGETTSPEKLETTQELTLTPVHTNDTEHRTRQRLPHHRQR